MIIKRGSEEMIDLEENSRRLDALNTKLTEIGDSL